MRSIILFLLAGVFSNQAASRTPQTVSLEKLPLFYETNLGQFPAEVKYLSRGQRFSLALTETDARLALPDQQEMRLEWEGASRQPAMYGQAETGGASNYFRNEDGGQGIVGARHYGRVRYASLYPGIDLVFYGSRTRPEFDFLLAPHADPRQIRIRVRGAGKMRVQPDGELAIALRGATVRLGAPIVYQPCLSGVCPVSGRYRVTGKDLLSFDIGSYDPGLPLVIDPTLSASYLGGSGTDLISGVAVDSTGNVYVTGYTTSVNFSNSQGSYKNTLTPGDSDAFVVKLNPFLTSVLYATYLGGPFADYGRAIAVDSGGAAYITGSTVGRWPVTAGAFRPQSAASPAIFLAKLNAQGNGLTYSTYLDGAGAGQAIAVNTQGQAFVAGWTYTATFTTTVGAYQRTYLGNNDCFVVKMHEDGNSQIYSTFLGGADEDQARGIAVNSAGEAFVTGFTSSTTFPKTAGVYRATNSGSTDAFVSKLNSTGTNLVYSTFLGASGVDRAHAIAIDSSGNAYVAGETYSASFPTTTGAYQRSLSGSSDAFVTKLNSGGTDAVYSTYLGGSGNCSVSDPYRSYRCDGAYGIALTAQLEAYVTGVAGEGFPQVGSTTAFGGAGDGFLAQLNSAGTALLYSTYLGGAGADAGLALAANGVNLVFGGFTRSTNIPLTSGSVQPAAGGGSYDGLLGRFGDCPASFANAGSAFPPSAGNYQNVPVLAATGCAWTVTSNASWATITNGSGSGNGFFNLSLEENTNCVRTGTLSLSGGAIFTITQFHAQCAQFSPAQSWFPPSGGTFTVYVWSYQPTTNWEVYTLDAFMTPLNGLARSGSGTVTITMQPNTGAYRYGHLYLHPFAQYFRVDQSGGAAPLTCSYSLSPGEQVAPSEGISGSFLVSSQPGCGWTATSNVPWVSMTSPSGSGDGVAGYEVGANATGQTRVGVITVGGRSFTVTQSAQ
ncbi:MAG: SBBP repeat-containing protein [Bryobacterales bacterium]|nr:SBBP repeat-containing protein [Bryobacterales bacterium]